jgi:DNA-binding MarR family transcriptional regulator
MNFPDTNPAGCNCLALRQATRHITRVYDRHLAPSGLRATQYSILARLKRKGPMTINSLAAEMVTDRTTLGRNILPLRRDGLITIAPGKSDRRSREICLTNAGAARLRSALRNWTRAQGTFERSFGVKRAKALRAMLDDIASTN